MPSGFDLEAERYDERRGQPDRREVDALVHAFAERRSILDVGGGTGRFSVPLTKAGHEVTIADLSRGMLTQARSKGLARLVRGNASRLPFRDAAFDGAFFVFLIHLVDEWANAVREIGRVTDGPVAAMLTEREPDLRAMFLETRSDMGHPTGRLDRGVMALTELIPPREIIGVSSSQREVDVAEQLAGYERPEAAPPGVHSAALNRVVSRYGSARVTVVEQVKLVTWPAKAFARFLPMGLPRER